MARAYPVSRGQDGASSFGSGSGPGMWREPQMTRTVERYDYIEEENEVWSLRVSEIRSRFEPALCSGQVSQFLSR